MASTQRLPSLLSHCATRASPSSYICKACRSKLLQPSKLNAQQLRHASNQNLPWTEKVRRKIWGTDNPPGLADPYGGPSFLEKRFRNKKALEAEQERAATEQLKRDEAELRAAEEELEREEREREKIRPPSHVQGTRNVQLREDAVRGTREVDPVEEEEEEEGNMEYKPAKTWDGLKHIGYTGHWEDVDPVDQDEYRPWYAKGDGAWEDMPLPVTRSETTEALHQAASEAGLDISAEELMTKKLDPTDSATFQILKNFSRLVTGAQFQLKDTQLNALFRNPSSTYNDIVGIYDKAINTPPPKNLYDALAANDKLLSQSNVMVLPRRETPVDKEKEVGRWKVIEKELKERGLPVLGKLQV